MEGKETREQTKKIIYAKAPEELAALSYADATFSVEFDRLMREKGFTADELTKYCAVSKTYINRLRQLPTKKDAPAKHPGKYVVVELCLELGADLEQTNRLLKLSGNAPLYSRYEADARILYGLTHGLDAKKIKESLLENGIDLF